MPFVVHDGKRLYFPSEESVFGAVRAYRCFVEDEGIQVELKGETPTAGSETEDEDTGNFYMTGGELSITNVGDKCIKTYGTISYTGGKQDFDLTNTKENATAISAVSVETNGSETYYDLSGRQVLKEQLSKGVYIIKKDGKTRKVLLCN